MVILISAASCTGKTLMAQRLLEKYSVPYLSVDHLKMGLYRSGKDYGFTPTDEDKIIESVLWPIIKGIIETNIENKQNIIIEGCYIYPHRLNEFDEEYRKEIIPVFMGFSRKYVENNYFSQVIENRNIIENRDWEEERTVEEFISDTNKLKKMCLEGATQYFEINKDYNEDTNKIYQWIDAKIEKRYRKNK